MSKFKEGQRVVWDGTIHTVYLVSEPTFPGLMYLKDRYGVLHPVLTTNVRRAKVSDLIRETYTISIRFST